MPKFITPGEWILSGTHVCIYICVFEDIHKTHIHKNVNTIQEQNVCINMDISPNTKY